MRRQDYFARYDAIPRLNNRKTLQQLEDEEQAAYVEQWHKDNPDGGWFNTAVLGCLFVIALGIGCVILSRPPIPKTPISTPHAFVFTCPVCHFPDTVPPIKSYAAYRQSRKLKVPPVDLSELERP